MSAKTAAPSEAANEYLVEAVLQGETEQTDLVTDGQVRIRRLLDERATWQYWGRIPASPLLAKMREGSLTKSDFQTDASLAEDAKAIVNDALPPGRVPPDAWRTAFAKLEQADLVTWDAGWSALDKERLGALVQPVLLEADARIEEEVTDRGAAVCGRLGGLLVKAAIQRHSALQEAIARLKQEIASVSTRDEAGQWQLDDLNRLEILLREEVRRFDDAVDVQHELIPPTVPNFDFGVRFDGGDDCIRGFTNMGHGLRRSVVFAMLRTLRRLKELSEPSDDGAQQKGNPLCLFLIE